MSMETNKITVDMGILTSSKDDLLRKFYDKIVNSPLDIRMIYKRLSKKKLDRDIIWGLISCIGIAELTEEEFSILEGWINLGDIYFDEKTMNSLLIHMDRGVRKYRKSKGLVEPDEDDSEENEDNGNNGNEQFDFEDYIKKFEVNSIIVKENYKLYHVCYVNDELSLCDRYNGDRVAIDGIVLTDNKMMVIKKGSDDSLLKDKKQYKIV